MRNRELKGAGLSRWRYAELQAFCRQYEEKRHAHCMEDCRIIEQAAAAADAVGYPALLKNVTQGIRYEESGYYGCRSDFFRARTRFFSILHAALGLRGQALGLRGQGDVV